MAKAPDIAMDRAPAQPADDDAPRAGLLFEPEAGEEFLVCLYGLAPEADDAGIGALLLTDLDPRELILDFDAELAAHARDEAGLGFIGEFPATTPFAAEPLVMNILVVVDDGTDGEAASTII